MPSKSWVSAFSFSIWVNYIPDYPLRSAYLEGKQITYNQRTGPYLGTGPSQRTASTPD